MEWEPTNEEDERADAAGQIEPDADGPAKLQTPVDAPKLAPESDTELDFAPNGAAGQGTGVKGEPPGKEPAEDELDDGERDPIEDEPDDVEWELIEDEPNDVEWDPVEDEDDGT